ncbi:hypothetical protein JTE90_024670 [Oedothorax gibbosus]|uniref:Serpin domain-containing protein n=1 Tax=Oedothorax gibbosus TaxID=931172 RepID=A0AAV6TWL4_9ARAC|nr:hypothetical protein JTE90_024670 [Oedothorax gibbosus]
MLRQGQISKHCTLPWYQITYTGANTYTTGNNLYHSGLLSSLDNSSDSYVLSCANSLVAQQDFAVKDEYKGLLTESFRASLFLADFKKEPEKAVADINKWVGEKTNGEA